MKHNGLKWEPWGTPEDISTDSKQDLFKTANWDLSVKYHLLLDTRFLDIPTPVEFFIEILWSILLNVLLT